MNSLNKTENNKVCDIVQDLLPLYHDGICSEKSRQFVEEHISVCQTCSDMLKSLAVDEKEAGFAEEAHDVLKRHAIREKRTAVKVGMLIAGVLMIPVIIAVILTLPGYSDWKTNAVLIASMLMVAGMTVVPLMSKTKKTSKAILFATVALLLIIFFVEMFFDNGGWLRFGEIAFSVIFSLSIVFAPIIIRQAELPDVLKNHKSLITMSWDTIWFYLMIFIFAIAYPYATKDLLGVSSFFMLLAWLIFLTVRYLYVNVWFKVAIIVILTGIWASIGNKCGWISIMDRQIHSEILITALIAGAVTVAIGIVWHITKNRKNIFMK